MADTSTILILVVVAVIVYFFVIKRKITTTGTTNGTGGGAATATTGGGTIYPAISHYPIANPQGQNQQITYASSGKAATSHRTDVNGTSNPNQEATVCLQWPQSCLGGGHPELAIGQIKMLGKKALGSRAYR